MNRRSLLVGTGTFVIAASSLKSSALASVVSDDTSAISESVELLPATDEIDTDIQLLHHHDLTADDIDDPQDIPELHLFDQLPIDLDDVSDSTMTVLADGVQTLAVATGDFEQFELGETIDTTDEWWIGTQPEGSLTGASTDGVLAFAVGQDDEERLSLVESVIDVHDGTIESVVSTHQSVDEMITITGDHPVTFVFLDDQHAPVGRDYQDDIDSLAVGMDDVPYERTGEHTDTVVIEPAAELDTGDMETILTELQSGKLVEFETNTIDEFVVAEAVYDLPPRRHDGKAPDAVFDIVTGDTEAGAIAIEHVGGESIDAERLELWLNGERVDEQPEDRFDEITQGDRITLDADPVGHVYLRWLSPDETVFGMYLDVALGADVFEFEYDPGEEALSIEYTAKAETDADVLSLNRRTTSDESEWDNPMNDLDTITAGDVIVAEPVGVNDVIELMLDIPERPEDGINPRTLLTTYRPKVPRVVVGRRAQEQPVMRVFGPEPVSAEELIVQYDGETVDQQLVDVDDTLEPGDSIELEDGDYGTVITIAWTAPPEPHVLEEHTIVPILSASVEYDDETGTATVSHEDGETVDVSDLRVRLDGEETDQQPGDELETFGPDEQFTVEADPFRSLTVEWYDGDESSPITRAVTGSDTLEGQYDVDTNTVEITYTGQVEADPDRLALERRSRQSPGWETDRSNPFADEHDPLTPNDTVTIEGVEPDERLYVGLVDRSSDRPSDREATASSDTRLASDSAVETDVDSVGPINFFWEFIPAPVRAFVFERTDETLLAKYRADRQRDAEEFTIFIDDEPADTQPTDEYDTLKAGDVLELDDAQLGSQVSIEWVVPDESIEIASHFITPKISFDVSVDEDAETLTLAHEEGDEIPGDRLQVIIEPSGDIHQLDEEGTISAGDEVTIEYTDHPELILILYNEQRILQEIHL